MLPGPGLNRLCHSQVLHLDPDSAPVRKVGTCESQCVTATVADMWSDIPTNAGKLFLASVPELCEHRLLDRPTPQKISRAVPRQPTWTRPSMSSVRALFEKVLVVILDQVRALLANHVDVVLDPAVRDDGGNRSIDDTEVVDAMDLEFRVNHTLVDVLG